MQNKIELIIANNFLIATSSDYAEKGRVEANISIGGRTATRTDITLTDKQSYRIIMIPIKSDFLRATIYGDPKNFDVLDSLIKSLKIR